MNPQKDDTPTIERYPRLIRAVRRSRARRQQGRPGRPGTGQPPMRCFPRKDAEMMVLGQTRQQTLSATRTWWRMRSGASSRECAVARRRS